jgi:hypothetical protein
MVMVKSYAAKTKDSVFWKSHEQKMLGEKSDFQPEMKRERWRPTDLRYIEKAALLLNLIVM